MSEKITGTSIEYGIVQRETGQRTWWADPGTGANGHESTVVGPDGTVQHYIHMPNSGPAVGWAFDPNTGTYTKFGQ